MAAADPAPMPPPVLVCVYYRVAAAQVARANAIVREFQRNLAGRWPALDPQLLVRLAVPAPDSSPDVPSAANPASVAEPGEVTLMETYRLPVRTALGTPAAEAILREFLHDLEAVAGPVTGLSSGMRHLELFSPCAS